VHSTGFFPRGGEGGGGGREGMIVWIIDMSHTLGISPEFEQEPPGFVGTGSNLMICVAEDEDNMITKVIFSILCSKWQKNYFFPV
jgi:hypothetical protein